ncbi:ribonuclease P protein component [Microbacterium caowuchunii]|uniref:Ribonuclease P protein component n=1 Tax=Microbacterium caowuchunii TaxID=2614638 RepID=A0A5J6KU84_9MICO|nr:ribonuclease P protein component [Microbacterium caowuchunii]KAA9134486.1 ribonuclease P protein component [Microbacterium caowuchunii]QEW01340.1 ribonuclease P protein component [Microbacterium caowuchunii]
MLSRPNRLTDGAEYRAVVRRGARCAGPHAVTYVVSTGEDRAARFGFIVSKKVGTAVVRNRVRRRLKAICASALPSMGRGADVVIRALPGAGQASFQELDSHVHRCLARSSV